jgi:hypothetical protein
MFLGHGTVALTGQRLRIHQESLEHDRTSQRKGMRWWFDYTLGSYAVFNRPKRLLVCETLERTHAASMGLF